MLLERPHRGVAAKTTLYKCVGMLCQIVSEQFTLSRFPVGTVLYLIIRASWRWRTWIFTDINLLMKLLEKGNSIQQRVTRCDQVSVLCTSLLAGIKFN